MLERDVRIEQRILVVEAGDEADRELAFGHRVDEAAAEFLEAQRIAQRVDDGAGGQPIGGNLPQLLDADREQLRLAGLRRAADAASAPWSDCRARRRRRSSPWRGCRRPARSAAFCSPCLPMPRSPVRTPSTRCAVHQDLDAGKAREQIDAFGFDQPGEPLHELVQRDDVVAVIEERRRRDREPELAAFGVRK